MPSVADIISELDDHGFEDTTSTRKVGVINDTVGDVCSREPWPFLEDSTAITLDVQEPTLPANFRAALGIAVPSLGDVLQPERLDTLTKTYVDLTQTGTPSFYYFVGEKLRVFPVPTQSYAGVVTFLKNHPTLVEGSAEAAILIPVRHHRVIVLGALARLYAMEDDPELAQLFTQQYEARIKTMENDTWKKQYDRTDREVDLNVWDDPWYC